MTNINYRNIISKSMQEKCGVFGIINANDASHKIYLGLHTLQHRGQDSAGIVTYNEQKPIIIKKRNSVVQSFFLDDINKLQGTIGLGHNRYATFGSKVSKDNIQPFTFKDENEKYFSICHNGNLTNAVTLRKKLELQGVKFFSDSDSEILGHLILLSKKPNLKEKLIESLNTIIGAYSYVMVYDNKLIAARDSCGIRPLVLGKKNNNEYCFASETVALDINHFTFVRNVEPGEVIIINADGKIQNFFLTEKRITAICAMEYVYFSRPDSVLEGKNVHLIREKLGQQLAIEHYVKADIAIGVPDSSLSSALGYSKQAKIPYEYGLIKNKYVGRSFILPSQKEREEMIKMKLNVNVAVIKNKDIVLIDDSIVRGTTMKGIVKLLKDAGAKKIHIRIASPEIKYPSFYGINIQNKHELALYKYTKTEYQKSLKYVDSLEFLSIDGMEKSIGLSHKNEMLDTSCFNGYYPIPLNDYENMR